MEQVNSYHIKTKWYEYAILLFMILWSGGGFTYGLLPTWMMYMLPIVWTIFHQRNCTLSKQAQLFISIVLLLYMVQMICFRGTLVNVVRPACTLLTCAMFAQIISNKFVKIYFNIIYFISFVCLTLWIICLIPSILSLLRSIANLLPLLGWENIDNNTNFVDTLYIFSIPCDFKGFMRNSGPFWEPGRFTIYITLALAINLFYYREKITSKKSLVLLFCNITTFSTTGYIAMAILFVGYIFFSRINRNYKIILSVILLIAFFYVSQLDFMTEKIATQSADNSTWSRFGAITYHWTQIIKSPIIGYGPFLSKVFGDELFSSPNGLTDLMRYYGIPLAIYIYYLLYKSTKTYVNMNNSKANICVFISLLLLCFSQTITYSPFFLILYFLANQKDSYGK